MRNRPEGLEDPAVVEALQRAWNVQVRTIDYAPVGFGAYHWGVVDDCGHRWFVTAHDTDDVVTPRDRVDAALRTARALVDAGLDFVIAPEPTVVRTVLHDVGVFALSLYRHVEGTTHEWGAFADAASRLAVVGHVAALHAVSDDACRPHAFVDDHHVPARDLLDVALDDLTQPWDSGPFGESTRLLLATHAGALADAFARYDDLVAEVAARPPDTLVLTHGEPHRANTIDTASGVVLVDWDTLLLAPRERDLWHLAGEDPSVLDVYRDRTGVTPDADALELYRLWWDLCQIAIYASGFHAPHGDSEDDRVAARGLLEYLDPTRW